MNKDKLLSIIGTRQPSKEGLKLTRLATEAAVKEGFIIVSGLARGIDTEAHKTTIKVKGHTIAVLGTPLNKIYPPENTKLAHTIQTEHKLISTHQERESSFGAHLFIRRNKYMAKISNATLVIETKEKSGTIHQCRECIRLGKPLFFSALQVNKGYDWVDGFIKQGAIIIDSPDEFIKQLNKKENNYE